MPAVGRPAAPPRRSRSSARCPARRTARSPGCARAGLDHRVAAEQRSPAPSSSWRRCPAAGRPRSAALRRAWPPRPHAAAAGWPGRISAGGVGPLPSSALRRLPPEPASRPSCVPPCVLRPRRLACCRPSVLQLLQCPDRAVRGVLDRRRRPRSAGRGSRRRRRSPCGPARPAAARAPVADEPSVTCGRSRRRPPPTPAHCGSSGSSPSTPSIARTDDARVRRGRCGRRRPARCCPRAPSRGRRRARPGCPGRRPSRRRTPRHRRCELGVAPTRSAHPAHERLDPPVRGRGLVERRVGVLDRRAVVRRHEVVAQLDRPHPLHHRGDEQRCCPATCSSSPRRGSPSALCSQYRAKPSPAALRLRRSFSWCGKTQVEPAAVDVELAARGSWSTIAEHSRCQPGRPRAPRRRPRRGLGSPACAAFHSVKSRGSRLRRRPRVVAGCTSSSRCPESAP